MKFTTTVYITSICVFPHVTLRSRFPAFPVPVPAMHLMSRFFTSLRPGLFRPAQPPSRLALPLFGSTVRAGFPSPADDYVMGTLDLNEYLVTHPEATFLVRASGVSMTGAGIQDGDVLVVDRSLTPVHRSVVIAVVDGEFTCKRLYQRGGRIRLLAEHPDYSPIDLADGQELQIWGVVTNVIHRLTP